MSVRALAAAFLAVGFAAVSYVAIAAEPGMGFTTPGDFLDPVKVATGYQSGVWRLEKLFYLGFPRAALPGATPAMVGGARGPVLPRRRRHRSRGHPATVPPDG